jgi:PhnB protein
MTDKLPPLIPHLCVAGAVAAIEFYKKALGATEVMRMPAEDGKRLMHAQLTINGATVFLMDDFPEHRGQHGGIKIFPATEIGGTPIKIHLEVPNCDEAVKRAEAAGAKVTMSPWDAFWGARYAEVSDPFGLAWSFAHPLPAK